MAYAPSSSEPAASAKNDYRDKWAFTEAYDLKSYGVLKIELFPTSYRWRFIPVEDNSASMTVVKDAHTDTCNRQP